MVEIKQAVLLKFKIVIQIVFLNVQPQQHAEPLMDAGGRVRRELVLVIMFVNMVFAFTIIQLGLDILVLNGVTVQTENNIELVGIQDIILLQELIQTVQRQHMKILLLE